MRNVGENGGLVNINKNRLVLGVSSCKSYEFETSDIYGLLSYFI